jgi:putative flavoprotein involved in K+ transport
MEAQVLPPERPRAVRPVAAPESVDLRAAGITSVVWATGYHREYPWLHVPVLDEHGEIRQRAGITPSPGLYIVGMRLQTRRSSNTLDGVGHDAAVVVEHLRRRHHGRAAHTGQVCEATRWSA